MGLTPWGIGHASASLDSKKPFFVKLLRDLAGKDSKETLKVGSSRCANQQMKMIPLDRDLLDFDEELGGVLFQQEVN